MADLLIRNIGMLATCKGQAPLSGDLQGSADIVRDAAVAVTGETIAWVGRSDDVPSATNVIDAGGKLVTPGLVDCHTHLVFGGWRQHETAQKLAGVSYLDILGAGGGILSTVDSTRKASARRLYKKSAAILDDMLARGVTTCEAKSGYGLTLRDEIKQLEVVRQLDEAHAVDIVPTFMGAHALPPEYKDDRAGYIDLLCADMIPEIAQKELAAFCDLFCETGVFTVDEARKILKTAREHGLTPKIHADEIGATGGSLLAAETGAVSAEHLIYTESPAMRAMAGAGVIGVLLPTTSFYLGKPYAKARDMLRAGMAIAVATDFNPGSSPCSNLQLSMTTACLKYRMTPKETLAAVTLNAAAAIGRADSIGTLEPGKLADILIWDAPDLDYIFYRLGANLVKTVIKKGVVI